MPLELQTLLASVGDENSADATKDVGLLESQLQQALKSGDVDSTSPLGQRCRRELSKTEEYKAAKSHKAKRDLRLKWATAKYHDIVEQKSKTEEYEEVCWRGDKQFFRRAHGSPIWFFPKQLV